ncbi:fungal-specific transcription factor domain-containing protein [Stachybotrys elegans]|uniref:Fungal-specific transcription factor domain-containing protein n=1 Tax=Stachybotrys elegans TaxID=80388 RepID=A0A8K0T2Q5_9HYPO|nr:fungal-specific transcription factor domain-containing protein [Stachybotrys elegans]
MASRPPPEAPGPGPPIRKRPRQRTPSPPNKRTQACERCWKRKQRCDRMLPNCTNCQRSGFECLARAAPLRESFEDVTLTHATLQSYLESLERNAIGQDFHVSNPAGHDVSAAAPRASTASPNNAPESDPKDPPAAAHQPGCLSDEEDPSVGDAMGAIGQLTNRAMAESRSEPDQSINKLTLLHMVQAALAIDGHDPSASTSRRLGQGDPDKLTPCALPPRQEAVEYIRGYLSAVYHIPCLVRSDETTLVSHLNDVAANAPEQQCSQPHINTNTNTSVTGLFEIHIQVAIGIMVSQDAVRLANYSHSLHGAATRLLPAVFKSTNYADSLRILLLLIAFSLVHPGGGSTWHLLGLAIRLCITAGFHKEPTSQAGLPSEKIEEARWLFWSVYVLDRCLSVAMDRPFGIQDGDISIQLPSEKSEDLPSRTPLHGDTKTREALGLHFIHHAQIISNIRTNSRANPMSHYGNLTNWRDFDPPLNSSSDMVRSWEGSVNQLECRGLLQIVGLFEEGQEEREKRQARADIIPARIMDEIQKDTRAACRRFIMTSYDRAGQWQTTRSFLDSYDLVAATVGYICLEAKQGQASPAGPRAQTPNKAELMEVVHKASVLVTQIASRFPALDGFHRFFLTLSGKAVGESPGLIKDCPQALPFSLRRLIDVTFSTVLTCQ